jgi:hypothetical protein
MKSRIVDLATSLVELGRMADRSVLADTRLPNALGRKGARAVAALLAIGDNANAVGPSGKGALEIAHAPCVESMLAGDKADDQ